MLEIVEANRSAICFESVISLPLTFKRPKEVFFCFFSPFISGRFSDSFRFGF